MAFQIKKNSKSAFSFNVRQIAWSVVSVYFTILFFFIFAGLVPPPFRVDPKTLSNILRLDYSSPFIGVNEIIGLSLAALASGAVGIYFYYSAGSILSRYISVLTGVGREEKSISRVKSPRDTADIDELEARVRELEAQERTGLPDGESSAISELVVKNMRSEIAPKLLAQIQKEHSESFQQKASLEFSDLKFEEMIRRLSNERQTITLWTFLNLMAGAGAAAGGAILLYYMILDLKIPEIESAKIDNAILGFSARLSLVIIVELFAYFFLNLYRTGLQEVKYYQNELTNVVSKQVALRAALVGKDSKTLSYATRQMMDTERNFVLKKGQSTVGLEQNKLDRTADNLIAETITSAVSAGLTNARRAATKRSRAGGAAE